MEYKAKKKYGQNFLTNSLIIDRIVDSVNVLENDVILEIGPGKGYLTKNLKRFNKNIIAFEIDEDMKNYLNVLEDDKLKVIYGDFLDINLSDYFNDSDKIHVIANIPYYITTPIIEKLIDSKLNILDMTLMVQKEVADRLSAKPSNKEYGYITVYLNYYFEVNKLFDVSRGNFDPVPNVDSAIIQLKRKENILKIDNENNFFEFLKSAFMMKRKNLRNNLKKYDLDLVSDVLNSYGLSLNNRAEEISLEVFIDIYNKINQS